MPSTKKILSIFLCIASFAPCLSLAAADGQAFGGFGLGFQVLAKDGSGTGLYFQGHGGYAFGGGLGAGLHVGYSNIGGVSISELDFGTFFQYLEGESGIYGRFYLDGVSAMSSFSPAQHGVKGNQVGFAPGAGIGVLIPSSGNFHMVPELAYRIALLDSAVNLISGTFNLVWDF